MRRASLMLMDGALLAFTLAAIFVLWLQFREGHLPDRYVSLYLHVVLPLTVLRLALFSWLGLYRSISRRAGTYELGIIALGTGLATGALMLFNLLTYVVPSLGSYPLDLGGDHLLRIPWGIVVNDWMAALIVVGGVRLLRRELELGLLRPRSEDVRRVLIVGAGDTGEQVGRDLGPSTLGHYRAVAYVDPDPGMKGLVIHGVPVAGGIEDLPAVIAQYEPHEIVIALQRPSPRVISQIVEFCRTARLAFKIVPPLSSLLSGRIEVNTLRPVEIEDLLGREPVTLGAGGGAYLKGRCILITGAGGSIGRELCRQAISFGPRRILMLGRGENSLFEAMIDLGPAAQAKGVELRTLVGDVRDADLVNHIFKNDAPRIVFHAAAHKHVHLMEAQPEEAIKNNVLGTLNVARAAADAGVERFIFISTDKAVRPVGFMGASKRIAEMIVSAINERAPGAFVSVRFGNVLGSRGSVIPAFRRQIERGGPVTVTHPEVTRYFMTTAEAVSLVIQAGAQGRGGELYVLDMGQPVKIADLARNLITLTGLEPEIDIPIVFTGMRPGEKLNEDLLTQAEGVTATEHGKIFITRNEVRAWSDLDAALDRLFSAADAFDATAIRATLKTLIPDFKPAEPEKPPEPHPQINTD